LVQLRQLHKFAPVKVLVLLGTTAIAEQVTQDKIAVASHVVEYHKTIFIEFAQEMESV
jgi:hypothetical protein